jgi:polyisoprenoid-binding protein YceI
MALQKHRRIKRHRVALIAVLSWVASAAASGGPEVAIELYPAETRLTFTVAGFPHSVHGTFQLTYGALRLNCATGEADGALIVDAASGVSGDRRRDGEMRDSILEAQRYPEIRFTPQHIAGLGVWPGEFPVTLRGSLWLH